MALILSLAVAASVYADPPLPVIPSRTTNVVVNFHATGDGTTDNAGSINAAITAINAAGGGTVEIPANGTLSTYMSGPITMMSSVNLQIDSNAMLRMFPLSIWQSNYGTTTFIEMGTLTDVEISGSGTIDGQGTNWWVTYPSDTSDRPHFIQADGCTRVLIQGVTLENPPVFTIYLKNGSDTSVTIQGITINTPYDSHNTDGADISATNVLIRNCSISTGDDDLEIGGSNPTRDITVSNCTFGTGHGVSMGSKIGGGVYNLTVSNCSWNNTEYGIKIKSDEGSGGLVQNIKYCDMTMTNVNFPIAMYMDYSTLGSPSDDIDITPADAAADASSTPDSSTPIYQNITISNLTAVGNSGIQGPGNIAGIIYGKPASPVSNVTLCKVNIQGRTSDGTFCIYHARNIQIIDSNLTAPSSGTNTLTLYNATVTITNSAPNGNLVTVGGLGSPSNTVLAFFNSQANSANHTLNNANPNLTLAASTLTMSNVLQLGNSSTLNFGLGTTATEIADTGSLTLGGTFNIFDAGGFTTGNYTLLTYSGALTDNGVTIGSTPNATYTYKVDTNTVGVVKLDVTTSCSVGAAGAISGPASVASGTNGVAYSISSVSGATGYAWTVPSGASVASGQGTTSITVNYACSAASGNVTVTPTNSSCSGTASSLPVTVTGVGAAGSITGPASINAGTNGVAYSISGVSGATTYTWTVPSGATIASGQGTTSIAVNYSCSAASGNVQVTPANANGCTGTSNSKSVTVTGVGAAGSISGSSSVNAGASGVTYSISSVSGATTYTWTVPSGATIASGQGTTSITVNYSCGAAGGNVQVTPGNANGCSGTAASLSITVTGVGAAGSISGSSSVNAGASGVTYSISSVSGATTYTWTVPPLSGASIASGQGTTSITVNYSCGAVGGNMQVTPSNANGCNGVSSSLPVTVTDVGAAALINGPTTVCVGQVASYSTFSVSGATTYIWIVPSGATITSGQGTTSISVTWGSTAGDVKLTPANANGCDGSSSSSSVAVVASPAAFNVTGGGSYCAASGGVTIGLDGSESSADYQLELNGNPAGAPVSGTGSAISFAGQTAVGAYTVIASNVTSGCTATMNGSASVTPGDPFTCWEEIYGVTNCALCDGNSSYTGDGMSNTNKFMAGFNPTNSAAYLHIISVVDANGTNIVVTYLAVNGDSTSPLDIVSRTNILEFATGTGDGSYSNNFSSTGQTNILSGGNGSGVVTNMIDYGGATNVPSRYYRVRVLLP